MPSKKTRIIRSTAEFARYVGLARTTVSRVLNGRSGLRPETVEQVHKAMKETGFTPNAHALHLRGKRTATIGICMENLWTPPALRKLAGLQQLFRARGYSVLIEVLSGDECEKIVRHFLSLRVEAIVFIGHFAEHDITRRIAELVTHDVPHLLVDQLGITGANAISLDRISGMRSLVTRLIEQGHTSFGILGMSGKQRSVSDRLQGIKEALVAAGLTMEGHTSSLDHLHTRAIDFEYGRALAADFVKRGDAPTAYLALNDDIAAGAIRGFLQSGLSVPGDVSVAGHNNQDVSFVVSPTITTIDQRIDETIEEGVRLLLSQIKPGTEREPTVLLIEPTVIYRESTGPRAIRGRSSR